MFADPIVSRVVWGVLGVLVFSSVLGWIMSRRVRTEGGRATVRNLPQGRDTLQPNWLPFVRVKNLQESLGLARQLGGRVVLEPKAQLLEGRVGVITDPTGAALGLMEWTEVGEGKGN